MTRREFLASAAVFRAGNASLRVSAFRADLTPPRGEPLIWTTPVSEVLDPLWAKGVVIETRADRCVLCAIDWCGIGSTIHELFRAALARATRTSPDRVFVHTVHQHSAPYVDGDAYALLAKLPAPPLRMSAAFLDEAAGRLGRAVEAAQWDTFDGVGMGEAAVEHVASARRLQGPDGKPLTRYSTGGRDPAMAAAPEGPIDPMLRTITLARGGRPLVRLHFYATHPQTFCCDGRASADFVGAAREAFEREEGVPQVYFTGCAGDVTVGKYNDTSDAARRALVSRLLAAFSASARATITVEAGPVEWRSGTLRLPPRKEAQVLDTTHGPDALYRSAIAVSFARRKSPLPISALRIGELRILQLPGEPMLAFQKFARALQQHCVVAGYSDISPGYLCTDRAYQEGGYEPGAANCGPGTETAVKAAIRRLLV